MEIRKIRKAEMATALQLTWETFLQFEAPDYSQQGIDSFYKFISNQEIIDSLEFFGAFDNNTLRGVIATNDNRKHICCFFVSAVYQKQGIGKQLLNYVKKLKDEMHLSVYQKNYKAISFYQRENFVVQAESIDNDTNEKELLMSWKK